jgi:hypothetical protein
MAACSLGGGDDDDDEAAGGSPGAGGSVVTLTGGTPNGLGGSANQGGSTGTSGGSSSTGGSATGMPEACPDIPELSECGKAAQTADIKVVNMMLVVDKSGSMKDKPQADQDSKWVMLGNALKSALGDVQEQMNLGLIMYPYDPAAGAAQTDVTCSVVDGPDAVNVPIGPGTSTVDDIVRIVQATTPSGGTPTAAALQAAYNYFSTGAGATQPGNKYVLLATDGGPNCNSLNTSCRDNPQLCTANLDAEAPNAPVTCNRPNCCITGNNVLRSELCLDNGAVVDAITKLKNAGVTTYVVGIPGTEVYSQYLDQFAEASGQISPTGPKKYYEVTADGGVKSLTDTFTGIVTQLVHTCDIPLDPAPDDVNFVNVAVDCELKTKDDPTAGWEIVDGNTLHLKGATCERVLTSGVKRVDLYYGCRPVQ